ncbi:MAG: FG-GAP repeat domain-containing protein [Mariniphaga sp.]
MKTFGFLLFLVFSGFLSSGQPFRFEIHEIGKFGYNFGATALVDVNKDGYLDYVYGRRGTMYWMEYISPPEWKLHDIGTGASTDVGGVAHDINRDGWIDFVVGDSWFENTGKPEKEEFILHKKNMIASHDNIAADIDGDGIEDIVAVSNNTDHNVTAWYKIPEDYEANWKYTKIGRGIHGGIGPKGAADLNNDDKMDIVRGDVWFENVDGKGKEWKEHQLIPPGGSRPDRFGLALKTWITDLNKDGMPDIIQAEADTPNGRVFWWENQNHGERFVFHPISADSTGQDFHSLAVADFNGDGSADVISGGGPLTPGNHKVFIWENTAGDGSQWKQHLVLEGKEVHELVAADVDGDGDIDVFSKPWRPGLHIYFENKQVE